ncbi:MAG: class I SAM-dependent RNA methyltransferase [Anaerolineales bacterium]|nr:class I SAM-dependent RNA methyltransferase [Anaerolineales bacterium]
MSEPEILELELSGLAYGGEAFGRDDQGRMVFVAFGLPNELVRVEIIESHARWARARLLDVLQPSPDRIEARCRHFGHCGGCHYQHMDYDRQLEVKRTILIEQLERIGGFNNPPVDPTVPSPTPWNYRNRLRFHRGPEGQLSFITMHEKQPFRVQECHLPEPTVDDTWPKLDLADELPIGDVEVRADSHDERMLVLYSDVEPDVELDLDLPASVVWLTPDGGSILAGDPHLTMNVLGRDFRLSPGAFFQVNSALTAALVERVLAAAQVGPGSIVYDLFAGVGLFSAFLADTGAQVIAVEESPWACADFEFNLAEFDSVALYEAAVETALPAIGEAPDVVILDPPRAGLSQDSLRALIEREPERIVYVSCDPATMARDGKRLSQHGYHLQQATPIDLFPQTYHLESLTVWLPE